MESNNSVKMLRLEESFDKAVKNQRNILLQQGELAATVGVSKRFKSFDALLKTVTDLKVKSESARGKVEALCERISTLHLIEEHEFNADWDARISEIDFDVTAVPIQFHGGHLGTDNPAEPKNNPLWATKGTSIVVLSTPQGAFKRIFIHRDEIYPDNPASYLGSPVLQRKDNYDLVRGLFIVGYVSLNGEKFGYIPNGNFNRYVYKSDS